jgi:hypothetical protein
MGKAEEKRAAIVAAQAAREAAEMEQRKLAGPPKPGRKLRTPGWTGRPRGRPPKPPE